jgi:hypothetical protein
MLEPLLRSAGYQNVQSRVHSLDFSAGTEAHADKYYDAQAIYASAPSFLIKAGTITKEEIDRLYQQLQVEMLADTFKGELRFLTAWGTTPE